MAETISFFHSCATCRRKLTRRTNFEEVQTTKGYDTRNCNYSRESWTHEETTRKIPSIENLGKLKN